MTAEWAAEYTEHMPDSATPDAANAVEVQNPYATATPSAAPGPKRVRTRHFQNAKQQGIPITGLTSYDMMTAQIFDQAGIDFLLVGDSAGNNVFGYETTLPVTVDELIPLTRAVARAVTRALVVADMPFGTYETGPSEALHTAVRFMKEAQAHAVKLEGACAAGSRFLVSCQQASRSWPISASPRRVSTAWAAT